MNPLGKPHVFPFVQAISAAFLAAGGAAFVSNATATTIMLMASGSTETIGENYNTFGNLRLGFDPATMYGGHEVKIMVGGIDGWDATSTSDQLDGSRWCQHKLRVRVSITSMSDVLVTTGVKYARFLVCAMSIVEDIQKVIDDHGGVIAYQTMTAQEVLDKAAAEKVERENSAIRSEIKEAVEHIRKGMRVEGKSIAIPPALIPEAMKHPGTYKIAFDDYGGKVVKRYEVVIASVASRRPYVRRVA